jgi:superfamily I DNA/RNA helicase
VLPSISLGYTLAVCCMPLEIHLQQEFEESHEKVMWDRLGKELEDKFIEDGRLHILLGNFSCERQFDALYICPKGICIIEFKAYSGELYAPQNEEWYVGDREVRAAGCKNPLKQVHSCKFKLIDRLQPMWGRIFGNAPAPRWHFINGRVVFNDPIVFEKRLDDSAVTWFRIKGLAEAASNLLEIHIKSFDLNDEQVRFVESAALGRNPGRNQDGNNGVQIRPRAAGVTSIYYLNQSDFADSLRALLNAQGDAPMALNLIKTFQLQLQQGRNPLKDVTHVERPEIEGLRIHNLTRSYRLLVIHHHGKNYLVKVCTEDEAVAWIASNAGLLYTVDTITGKIQPTMVDLELSHSFAEPTKDNIPFIERVAEDLTEAEIPPEVLLPVALVNENTTLEERLDALSGIEDPAAKEMAKDVIELLRQGKRDQAIARIKLYSDQAVPISEAPELQEAALTSVENSEVLVDWKNLTAHELEQLIRSVPEDKWMLFLHPGQIEVTNEDFAKTAVLTGVSGSGKTAVLMHRAKRMAQKYPAERVLVLALNKSLATMISRNLDALCGDEERARIHVLSFHDYLERLLQELDVRVFLAEMGEFINLGDQMRQMLAQLSDDGIPTFFKAKDESELMGLFDDFMSGLKGEDWELFSDLDSYLLGQVARLDVISYLFEEMELVRSAFTGFEDYAGYLKDFRRQGRAIPFQPKHRNQVLHLLKLWEAFQLKNMFLDHMGLTQAAFLAIERVSRISDRFRYRCVLVDEFQDFSNLELRIIARIPKAPENGLFLTGDYAQKLYAKQLNLREADLWDRVNRKILKNYRNTRQILHAANTLLHAYPAQQEQDGEETSILPPEYAILEAAKPTAYLTTDPLRSAWRDALLAVEDGVPSQAICIISANTEKYPLEEIVDARPEGLEATELSGWDSRGSRSVVVSDIMTVKGFEFRNIFILGLEKGIFPPVGRMPAELWRDAQRLYVAITRGRNEVRFYYQNEASPFLRSMGDTVAYADAALLPELKSAEVVAEIKEVEMPAKEHVKSVPEPLIEEPEEPLSVPAETDYFSDGSWYRITVLNSEKIVTFRRQPNQIDLARILGTTPTQISNWLHDGPNLHLVPSSPLEWPLVEYLTGKLNVTVEYHEKGKSRAANAPAHRPLPSAPAPTEAPAVPASVPIAGGEGIVLGDVVLGKAAREFNDLAVLFGGEDNEPVSVLVTEYPVTGPRGLSLMIHVKRSLGGRGQITCGENHTTDPKWQRLVNRLRQSIYDVPGECGDSFFMELEQARFQPGGNGWSGRYKPTFTELDEGAGLSVKDCLIEHGADMVATRGDVYGEENRRRSWPCVRFGSDAPIVPVVAYVVTTVLPLLHGITNPQD